MNIRDVYFVFIFGTLFLILFASALIFFLIHYKRKQTMHITEKLELSHQFQQQLLQSRLEVQEQSFRYFSEEIHDNVGQVLTTCKLYLHQLGAYCQDEQAEGLIRDSSSLLSQALTDLRTISHTLNGNYVGRAGLTEALKKEMQYIISTRKIKTELETSGEQRSMPAERELLIFRIIQEAIANALKHGNPDRLQVILNYDNEVLHVLVADNGSGFDPDKSGRAGIGMDNMHLRAGLLMGTIQFRSEPGSGTEVTLKIPYSV